MKKKVLILFKYPWDWNKFIINKLSKYYEVKFLYVDHISNKNFSQTVDEINDFIESNSIEIVFFDVDYFRFFNLYFIKKIKNVKKILMTFDDYELHEINSLTATSCDLVLSACALSVLKYKEKGFRSFLMMVEGDGNIFKNYNQKKDIDVLFFGGLNQDRKILLNFLKENGISVETVGKESHNFVKDEELSKIISRSKIVLNLSKSTWGAVRNYPSGKMFKFYYQFKGRVVIAGLCGTACVSEFFPTCDLLFGKNTVPTFHTKEECLEILKNILGDKNILNRHTEQLSSVCLNLYEDEKNLKPIYKAIENLKVQKAEIIKIPYWYQRICAKMIILRNIKNLNLFKAFFGLRDIFPVISNTNIVKKLMIIIESVLNIFWYSIKTRK